MPSSAATGGWKPEQQWLDLTTRDCLRRRERSRILPPSFLRRGGWPTTGPAATRWRRRSAIRRVLRAQGGGLACQGGSRANGCCTDPHGKEIFVVRRDGCCRRRCGGAACLLAPRGSEVMCSLHDELAAIEDFRRAGSTRCAHVLAELVNMKGSCAVCAVAVPGRARGHRRKPRTGCASRPPGRPSTGSSDPEALENMLGRHGRRRLARALAADGKRIRCGNGDHETVALTPPAHPSRC